MIFCKELNKNFEDKDSLFKELMENKELILTQKKSVFNSVEKGLTFTNNQNELSKFLNQEIKGLKMDDDYYYFVVNSANILDSHNDMHVDGNWNKTVKEKQGKNYLVWEHQLTKSNVIAFPQDIEIITASVPFKSIGKNYEGESYSLIYKVAKDKIIDQTAKEWLEKGVALQASVRMQYVKIEMAFNSTNPEYAKEKSVFDTYYPQIANKNDFEEINYFWVVKEANNVQESSLVLLGSNNATGRIIEQSKDTQTSEQSKDTQEKRVLIF